MIPGSRHLTLFPALLLVLSFTILTSNTIHGQTIRSVIDSPTLTQKIRTNRTLKVDVNGNGDFLSIQAAIDSVPDHNNDWIIIHVRKGIYREKVHVPKEKPNIFMRGNGKGRTWLISDQSSSSNTESATFKVEANNFVAFGISFKNTAISSNVGDDVPTKQSVAVYVSGDKVAFYHCAFYSAHNTLFDQKGRHYYANSYIQGSVDFIFGRGRSFFQNCEIFVNADKRVKIYGSITAQNRKSESERSGFVFSKGKVYGIGGVYLGRAKGAYSRVVFNKVYFSKTIVPHGWTNWSYNGTTEGWGCRNLFHAEHKCFGPGADGKDRVHWTRQLTDQEVHPFSSVDFIDGKEWLPAWI